MLSIAEVAARTGIPKRTVSYAVLHGTLKATKIGPKQGTYVIDEEDLEEWLAAYLPVYRKHNQQKEK